MTRDKSDLIRESREILSSLRDSNQMARLVVDSFVQIKPPQGEMSQLSFGKGLDYLSEGATSTKPGNIVLNWKNLCDKVPEIVLTVAGASQPWLLPVAALHIWTIVKSISGVTLSPNQGIALLVMWRKTNGKKPISEEQALMDVNSFLVKHELQPLEKLEFSEVINKLDKMKCIKLIEGLIHLCEEVTEPN